MTDTQLGLRLKRLRASKHMSAEDVAAASDCPTLTRSIIANLETGRKDDLTVRQLLGVMRALDVSAADIVPELRVHEYAAGYASAVRDLVKHVHDWGASQ